MAALLPPFPRRPLAKDDGEGGEKKIKIWLCKDPVSLHLQIHSFKVNCCFMNTEDDAVKINDGDSSPERRMSFNGCKQGPPISLRED